MASISIPAVNESYEYPGGPQGAFKKDMIAAIAKLRANYMSGINAASTYTGVPASILTAFSVVENTTVNPSLRSSAGAYGLMQVVPSTGAYAINRQAPNMSAAEKEYIKRFIPAFNSDGSVKSEKELTPLVKSKITNPDFNLYLGALLLSSYLNESNKKYNAYRLDHAIIKYNAGIGTFNNKIEGKGLAYTDTAGLVKNSPNKETKNYLLKVMGVNGTLHIMKQQGIL